MRRLSHLVDHQNEQNVTGNDNISLSYMEDESTICGHKTHVVKNILKKMVDYQTDSGMMNCSTEIFPATNQQR